MVCRKGGSQFLGTPAIHLSRACLASCLGNLAYDFLMSVCPDQFIMPHRSSRGSTRSVQASFTRTLAPCDKSVMDSSFRLTRHPIRVGTWNIRTLSTPGSSRLVTNELSRAKISIMALQEVRWSDAGKTTVCLLYTSPSPRD